HLQPAVVRDLTDWQVIDLLDHTRPRLGQERVRTVEDVRRAAEPIVSASPEVRQLKTELEAFLRRQVYGHHRVIRMSAKGRRFLRALFDEFCREPEQLPGRYAHRARTGSREQTVCDYLAGMTDHYAQDEYLRLFQPYTSV